MGLVKNSTLKRKKPRRIIKKTGNILLKTVVTKFIFPYRLSFELHHSIRSSFKDPSVLANYAMISSMRKFSNSLTIFLQAGYIQKHFIDK
jgi:hypothetical protein